MSVNGPFPPMYTSFFLKELNFCPQEAGSKFLQMVMPICQTIRHYIPEHRNLHSITCSSVPRRSSVKTLQNMQKSTQSTKLRVHTSVTYWYIRLKEMNIKLYAIFTLKV